MEGMCLCVLSLENGSRVTHVIASYPSGRETRVNLCYVLDKADSKNPALAQLEETLQTTPHAVRRLGVRGLTAEELISQEESAPADCYLLKSRSPQAIALARHFEQQGKLVVNNT